MSSGVGAEEMSEESCGSGCLMCQVERQRSKGRQANNLIGSGRERVAASSAK